jgi:predicted ATPase
MAHLKYFGLKNFRVFDEEGYLFKFAPITLITGANNSGKSSIFKALSLMKESFEKNSNLDKLDLTKQPHHLGTFANLLHDEKAPLTITIPFPFLFREDLVIVLSYDSNESREFAPELDSFEVLNVLTKEKVISSKMLPITPLKKEDFEDEDDYHYNRIVAFFEIFIDYNLITQYAQEIVSKWEEHIKLMAAPLKKKKKKRSSFRVSSNYRLKKAINDIYGHHKNNWALQTYIDKSEFKYSKSKDTLLDILKKIIVANLNGSISKEIKIYNYETPQHSYDDNLESPYSLIRHWTPGEIEPLLVSLLKTELNDVLKKLYFLNPRNITQLSSIRGISSRFYSTELNNTFNTILKEFTIETNHREHSSAMSFINKCFGFFDIGKEYELKIRPLPDYGLNEVKLKHKKSGASHYLVDFGYGVLQIVAILLKIAVEGEKHSADEYNSDGAIELYPHILIIDEPESNLHPNWQSKLADVFVCARQTYNIQLIIETHSEYLIRRFQYLVAKEKVPSEGIKLYYVNNNNKTATQNKIEEIQIEPNGNIDFSKFGAGFFDVSLDLITSLWDAQISKTLSEEEKTILRDLSASHKKTIELQQELAKIQADKENDNLKALKVITEKVTDLQSTTKNIEQTVEKTDENIITILKGFKDFSKTFKTFRETLELIKVEETKRFERLHAFFDKFWAENATDIHDHQHYIEDWLTNWEKLDDRSHLFLLHAEFATRSLKKYSALDYSLSILQYCRILERELSVQIFNPFKNFLIEKYWKDKSPSDYDILFTNLENQLSTSPEPANLGELKRLWSLAKNLRADTSKTPETVLSTSKAVMLGQSIDGLYLLDEISIGIEPLMLEFKQFIKHNLNWNNVTNFRITPDLTQSMFSGVPSISFIDCMEELRKNYRNNASHTSTLDEKAMDNTKKSVELLLQFWTEELLK